ncbi:hypothetical protein LV457_19725 [Mycobacterium sp. MYCO198283]|uniref:hypothetical protein n=1 Tax=Mycobacterium sp. MYCO198283 TaxID=2883505 RepID=UPI001E5498FF|nr:hypothetical protein [Mycobacterium sp. MYCO198283]MCG5434504.1 hypothetical protein [Mycobacterium sp. MYCO198283]
MTGYELRGIELRYALAWELQERGNTSVTELVDALTARGFGFAGRPSKAVSDALRWEQSHGRVLRRGRGRYGPGDMPRATEYRIHQRVQAMRNAADAALSLGGGQSSSPAGRRRVRQM